MERRTQPLTGVRRTGKVQAADTLQTESMRHTSDLPSPTSDLPSLHNRRTPSLHRCPLPTGDPVSLLNDT